MKVTDEMPAEWDQRPHAILFDRRKRDFLARINGYSVEPLAHLAMEARRVSVHHARVCGYSIDPNSPDYREPLMGWQLDKIDQFLILTANEGGWRGDQAVRALLGRTEEDIGIERDITPGGRGLRGE